MEPDRQDASIVLNEEAVRIGTRSSEIGTLRLTTSVSKETLSGAFDRRVEDADISRGPAGERDSGEIETLPDGSVSIPLFEEELVVTRRLVVRERIVVRKRTEKKKEHVQEEVRRETVTVEQLESED